MAMFTPACKNLTFDLEKIKSDAREITATRKAINRLSPENERSRLKAGSRMGEASLIVQGSESQRGQSERRSEQEGQRQRLPKRSNMTVELSGGFIWRS